MIIISDPTFEIQGCLCFPPKQYKHKKKYQCELLKSDQKSLKTLDIQTVQRCWLLFIICIFCAKEAVVKNYSACIVPVHYLELQHFDCFICRTFYPQSSLNIRFVLLPLWLIYMYYLMQFFKFNIISKWALSMTFLLLLGQTSSIKNV